MRFLLDMGISPRLVCWLEERSHSATHLHPQGLRALEDPLILEKARAEGRILLTHDLDFPDLLAASGDRLPSVVVFRLKDMRPPRVAARLAQVLDQCSAALEQGAVVSVTEGLIRVRALPLDPSARP